MTDLITREQLNQIMPTGNKSGRLDAHWPFINPALRFGKIETPRNIISFMGQVAQESGEYQYTREIASGAAYEGRLDLGNTEPGDGVRYPGRGAIQNTGRAVARACGKFFNQPFEEHPELMEKPEWATHVSVWFWSTYKTLRSNKFKVTTAYLPLFSEMNWYKRVTLGVNGGYTHLDRRLMYCSWGNTAYGLPQVDSSHETDRIKAFQAMNGLEADGNAGGDTAAAVAKFLGVLK